MSEGPGFEEEDFDVDSDLDGVDDVVEDDDDLVFDLDEEHLIVAPSDAERTMLPGGDGLVLSEANELVGDRPTKVILIAGPVNAGKTTLLVELFAQFLQGPFRGWSFAGSQTIAGFDRRHKPARASSGSTVATTARTQDDELRHLHLAVAQRNFRTDLLLSDLRGEVFESIVDGADARRELSFLPRVDACLVLLDGELMTKRSSRDLELLRARQLLWGLVGAGGLSAGVQIALVVTKSDVLSHTEALEVMAAVEKMAQSFDSRDNAISTWQLSARPADDSTPVGLGELFDFMTSLGRRTVQHPRVSVQGRHFWQGSGE